MKEQPPHVRVVTAQEAREMAEYYRDGGEHWLATQWQLRADELAKSAEHDQEQPR